MIIYAMLRLESLGLAEYVVMILVSAIMLMTKAQADIACCFLLIAGLIVYRLTKKWHHGKAVRLISTGAVFSYVILAVLSFAVTLGFNRDDQNLRKKLQYSLIRRLEMNQQALRDNPLTLFGTKIEEHGFGGRTTNLPGWDKYFFVDCSYIRLLVIGGIMLFVLILMTMTYAQIRCFAARNYGFIFLLTLVAAACVMEHHLMEYYYNVFPLMAFSGSRFLKAPKKKRPDRSGTGSGQVREEAGAPAVPGFAEAGDIPHNH